MDRMFLEEVSSKIFSTPEKTQLKEFSILIDNYTQIIKIELTLTFFRDSTISLMEMDRIITITRILTTTIINGDQDLLILLIDQLLLLQ